MRPREATYLLPGYFDQDAIPALLGEVMIAIRADEVPLARVRASPQWYVRNFPGFHDIVEFEKHEAAAVRERTGGAPCCEAQPGSEHLP